MKMPSRAAGASPPSIDQDIAEGIHRLRFNAGIESDYQAASGNPKRIPRILLFAFLGLCFALAPLYQMAFFDVAGSAADWLRIFEVYAVGPLSFAAALATYLGRPKLLTELIQSIAVVVLWVSPLFLRYLALHGGLQYPCSMIGIVVIAIAIFGGFNYYIFSLGAVIVLAVGGVQEVQLGGHSTEAWLNVNALVLSGLIAVLGAYAIEVSHRLAWANGRAAERLMTETRDRNPPSRPP